MNCTACDNYNKGFGKKACLTCPKYRDITMQSSKRRALRYEVIPQNLLEQVADDQRDRDLNRAIDDLPNDLGDIITLRFFRRRSYGEIASSLNLSESSVRRKLKEALEMLK